MMRVCGSVFVIITKCNTNALHSAFHLSHKKIICYSCSLCSIIFFLLDNYIGHSYLFVRREIQSGQKCDMGNY